MNDLLAPLHPSSVLERGVAGLWLRRRAEVEEAWEPHSLDHAVSGAVAGLRWSRRRVSLLDRTGWSTEVLVTNESADPISFDLLCVEDPSLSPPEGLAANRLYPSQYLDLTPIDFGDRGVALAIRQNMPGATAPWALVGSHTGCVAWATDALQLLGRGLPEGAPWPGLRADLPGSRLQHEHAAACLQSEAVRLAPGASWRGGFFLVLVEDHPEASSQTDAAFAEGVVLGDELAHPAATGPGDSGETGRSLVDREAAYLPVRDLTEAEIADLVPGERLHPEEVEGRTLGWFTPQGALVVTAAKQRAVLRPHGQILRPLSGLLPGTGDVTNTVWMDGGFCTQLTQGHAAKGRILSSRLTPLGIGRMHGLRIVVDLGSGWQLLGTPSVWLSAVDGATWWYATADRLLRVVSRAPDPGGATAVEVTTLRGEPVPAVVVLSLDWSGAPGQVGDLERDDRGLRIRAPKAASARKADPDAHLEVNLPAGAAVADDRPLFRDGASRGASVVTIAVPARAAWSITLTPHTTGPTEVQPPASASRWDGVHDRICLASQAGTPAADLLSALDQMTGWYAHDALVHYLSPRGLEQQTGGAWGTRDVAQGPVGLLRSWAEHDAWRSLLLLVFGNQLARGDWYQAFEFLPGHTRAAEEPHGDVVYWPLLALGQYLGATGDTAVLAEQVPFDDGPAVPLSAHVARALDLVESTFVPGTALPAYGHGDWNDSLQPADPDLARHMVSTWTVVLQAEALGKLARGIEACEPGLARRAASLASAGTADLRAHLLLDGVLAGYGVVGDDGRFSPLLHPRDTATGLTYSLLPMIHAISGDLLTLEEADRHLDVVRKHLTGPDGVRLFDRPVAYRGGPMKVFRRAEASSFFGREIGIMYVHAHLRYAEALARRGDGVGLLRALAQAVPVGLDRLVPCSAPRQLNTYSSTSDAAFADRYEAAANYSRVLAGEIPLEAGWRVYSSGPGLFLEVVTQRMLGIRHAAGEIEIDPVVDPALGRISARLPVWGRPLHVVIEAGPKGHGVAAVSVDGVPVPGRPLVNRYREAGVAVPAEALRAASTVVVTTR